MIKKTLNKITQKTISFLYIKFSIQYQGIIGIIQIINHMAWDTNPRVIDLDSEVSINTLTLQDSVAKKAADYICKLTL